MLGECYDHFGLALVTTAEVRAQAVTVVEAFDKK